MSPDSIWHLEEVLIHMQNRKIPGIRKCVLMKVRVQLTRETRQPLLAQPGQPARYDTEYKREGTANLFLFVQPCAGGRHVNVTHQRTKTRFCPANAPAGG
ncbi:MAG: hypothetical protein IPL59_24725 [Candidatus Competibacteraceae bacterium]|nr:hypothetical protein [Candidatus Competibacteraceae bacterium]